jgi:hypothetical protein
VVGKIFKMAKKKRLKNSRDPFLRDAVTPPSKFKKSFAM